MSLTWRGKTDRSLMWVLRLARWLALNCGRRFLRLLLYPICIYYFLFTRKSKKISRQFLEKVLQRKVNYKDLFKHYYTFASVILDRVYFVTNQQKLFSVKVHGLDVIKPIIEQKKGALLFGAHLGSFEALRSLGDEKKLPVRLLMNVEGVQKVQAVLHELNPELEKLIITMGRPESLLELKEALEKGALVGILADRIYQQHKTRQFNFLGEPASFSESIFHLAKLCGVPVIFTSAVYDKKNRYEIFFEAIDMDGSNRIAENMQTYVNILERQTKRWPYNWFNFYDYWQIH